MLQLLIHQCSWPWSIDTAICIAANTSKPSAQVRYNTSHDTSTDGWIYIVDKPSHAWNSHRRFYNVQSLQGWQKNKWVSFFPPLGSVKGNSSWLLCSGTNVVLNQNSPAGLGWFQCQGSRMAASGKAGGWVYKTCPSSLMHGLLLDRTKWENYMH